MEVYIIRTDTGTLLSRVIKMYTGEALNHVSISFCKELEFTYSFGRKNINNPFLGGFIKENLKGSLFQDAGCEIYRCEVSVLEFKQMFEAVKEMENQKYLYKYNFLGLFGIPLKIQIERKNAFFCSEFVATILKKGGIIQHDMPSCLIKPIDLTRNDLFQLVYSGKLDQYFNTRDALPVSDKLKEKKVRLSIA